jgi:hypothetical protein
MKCVACGSASLIEGNLMNMGDGGTNYFNIKDISTWKSIFGKGIRKVKAYGCVNCYHLQLAVDFSNEDQERYRQFEGVQPSLMERINAEEE